MENFNISINRHKYAFFRCVMDIEEGADFQNKIATIIFGAIPTVVESGFIEGRFRF